MMKESKALKKIQVFTILLMTGIRKTGCMLWKILTFSLADINVFWTKNICVSISIGSLSIAYGSRFLSSVRIKDFRFFPFESNRYPDPEIFSDNVFSAINDLKAKKTDFTLSIPKEWTIIQTAEFPIAVKGDLSNAVSYELDRLTPISPENALYDYKILKEENDKIHVLLFVARADSVNQYIEALKTKGIRVNRLTINLSGISSLLSYMGKKNENTVFVEISKYGYEGGFIADGSVISGFTGRFSEKDNKEYKNDILKEIDFLIDYSKSSKESLKIIADLNDRTGMILENKLSIPVVNLRDMDIKLKPAKKSRLDINNLSFMSIGGTLESLWLKNSKPNLLCNGVHKESKVVLASTAIFLVVIIVMGIFSYVMPFETEKKRVVELDRQIIQIKNSVAKVEKLKKEVDLVTAEITKINDFKQNNHMLLTLIKEFTVIIPQKAWLTRMKITETTAEIEGYADNANELLPKLEASPYFNKVEFASATIRNPGISGDRFSIKMEITGSKNDKKEILKKNEKK